jgi:hypothetical protein
MSNDLLSSGSYGCVFYPSYSCNGKPKYKKTLVSKLTKNNFVSENEYSTSQIVKKIPNYKEHFVVIDSQCPIVKKNLITSNMYEQCELIKKDNHIDNSKYILMYSKYKSSVELHYYLIDNTSTRILIKTYMSLLKKIEFLIEKEIVHNDLHFSNVLYELKTGNLLIIDFGLSIQKYNFFHKNGSLNIAYLKNVFNIFYPSWMWYSLDFHLLTYLLHVGDINDKIIDDIITRYLDKHIITEISNEYLKIFRNTSYEYFTKNLSGMSYEEKIKFLLSFWNTWDNYKISLEFIRLYIKNSIQLKDFFMILLLLIHPNPEYRLNGLELRRYNSLLIKQIPTESIKKKY